MNHSFCMVIVWLRFDFCSFNLPVLLSAVSVHYLMTDTGVGYHGDPNEPPADFDSLYTSSTVCTSKCYQLRFLQKNMSNDH